MRKIKQLFIDLQILEFNFINISMFLNAFNIEILYFVVTFDSTVNHYDRGLFRLFLTKECLYFDLLYIKFCIYDKTGREFYIK